jgi:DtxR family Mn-dependent transcriptional regulator
MFSENQEDYIRAIFTLSARKNRAIRTKELAEELGVSSASVTEMIGRLSKASLVVSEPYYGFSLTKKGILEAFRVLRKHRLLEKFLVDILELPATEVHAEAHRLEHVVSDEALDKIDCLLKSPCYCPHKSRIPGKDDSVYRIDELKPGEKARIVFSRMKTGKSQERLNSMGMVPGSEIQMVRKMKKGPNIIKLKGSELALDKGLASQFYVKKDEKA